MKVFNSLLRASKGKIKAFRAKQNLGSLLQKSCSKDDLRIEKDHWHSSLTDPTRFYLDCVRYFHFYLPVELQKHRQYFQLERRGFGEDAFHVMWWLLFTNYRPKNFLEIGVYRGQTLSLAALLQRELHIEGGQILGVSPFISAGDSVSKYRKDVSYLEDTLINFQYFQLPEPELLKAFSTEPLAVECIRGGSWDLIYIDGNHDYEVALSDWESSVAGLSPNGLIVLDDSGLSTEYRPPSFATGGHPGPSRLANEINRDEFEEILQVGHNRVFRRR